mgnify:CR=1 FL=1
MKADKTKEWCSHEENTQGRLRAALREPLAVKIGGGVPQVHGGPMHRHRAQGHGPADRGGHVPAGGDDLPGYPQAHRGQQRHHQPGKPFSELRKRWLCNGF